MGSSDSAMSSMHPRGVGVRRWKTPEPPRIAARISASVSVNPRRAEKRAERTRLGSTDRGAGVEVAQGTVTLRTAGLPK